MTVAVFLLLLLGAVPIALVLALTVYPGLWQYGAV